MNVEDYTYTGEQQLTYTNNSPETLHKVFYHLYFNAFQPGSEMAARVNNGKDKNTRFNVNIDSINYNQQGYLKVYDLKQDGKSIQSVLSGTILEVTLIEPIKPGNSTIFSLNFEGKVPDLISDQVKIHPKVLLYQWHNGTQKWQSMIMKGGMQNLIWEENSMVFGATSMSELP